MTDKNEAISGEPLIAKPVTFATEEVAVLQYHLTHYRTLQSRITELLDGRLKHELGAQERERYEAHVNSTDIIRCRLVDDLEHFMRNKGI